jgi:hypothetical protein
MPDDFIVKINRQFEGEVVVSAHSAEEAVQLVDAMDIHRLVDVLRPTTYGTNSKAHALVRLTVPVSV